ncbi:hypothetical protein BB8028_0006g05680 [Beauveria bassiana]|uniref:Uncharacterized protein n=1 Tax=Beauveria bassiana TaxID=176275 RepID=A0A2S7YJG5_BEABA|nr:hypothetical protein BB8028_0006g05680 [Beauveria bassiana]
MTVVYSFNLFLLLPALLALTTTTTAAQAHSSNLQDGNGGGGGCTTTSTTTQTMSPTPPYWPQCEFDSTLRTYPSTVTSTTWVDCHECEHLFVKTVPQVYCQNMRITATASTRETTPYTEHETVCSPTMTPVA